MAMIASAPWSPAAIQTATSCSIPHCSALCCPSAGALPRTMTTRLAGSTALNGETVTFTASVAWGEPGDEVKFLSGTGSLSVATLSARLASLLTPRLTAGTQQIVASYRGDEQHLASQSQPPRGDGHRGVRRPGGGGDTGGTSDGSPAVDNTAPLRQAEEQPRWGAVPTKITATGANPGAGMAWSLALFAGGLIVSAMNARRHLNPVPPARQQLG
ncbi:hypothetical protein ACI1US_01275 [Leucobacter sp. BZR 635]